MAALQPSPSLGFSRQEHRSGLPFPSPMCESEKWQWSLSVVSDLSNPMNCSPPGSSVHGIFQARVLEWGAIAFSVLVTQLYPTLYDPMHCSPPGSSVHRILQARILEWVAIPFSRGSSWPRDPTWVSWIEGSFLTIWVNREAEASTKDKTNEKSFMMSSRVVFNPFWLLEGVKQEEGGWVPYGQTHPDPQPSCP